MAVKTRARQARRIRAPKPPPPPVDPEAALILRTLDRWGFAAPFEGAGPQAVDDDEVMED